VGIELDLDRGDRAVDVGRELLRFQHLEHARRLPGQQGAEGGVEGVLTGARGQQRPGCGVVAPLERDPAADESVPSGEP
jgi:hypothetical protein